MTFDPNKKYGVIYTDPPWSYTNQKTGRSHTSGASQQYPVMKMKDIIDLPVKNITDKNAVLFMWITTPIKYDKLSPYDILKSWGFKYKTTFYWNKQYGGNKKGMGYYYRGQVEELIIAVKGEIKAFHQQIRNIIDLPVQEHSVKPDWFYELIEKSTEHLENQNRIELFAARPRDGWDSVGFDIDGKDIREVFKDKYEH